MARIRMHEGVEGIDDFNAIFGGISGLKPEKPAVLLGARWYGSAVWLCSCIRRCKDSLSLAKHGQPNFADPDPPGHTCRLQNRIVVLLVIRMS